MMRPDRLLLAVRVVDAFSPDSPAGSPSYFFQSRQKRIFSDLKQRDSQRSAVILVQTQDRAAGPQERRRPSGKAGRAIRGALSLVSKFYVRVGERDEGIVIRTNFATGNAARALTSAKNAEKAIGALMEDTTRPNPTPSPSPPPD